MDNIPAYDATYALTHLLRTLHASTKPGERFDATTLLTQTLTQATAGVPIPPSSAGSVLGPSHASAPAQTFRLEKSKGKDK